MRKWNDVLKDSMKQGALYLLPVFCGMPLNQEPNSLLFPSSSVFHSAEVEGNVELQ